MGAVDYRHWNLRHQGRYRMGHAGYEDYQRHVSDYRNNHEEKTEVLRNGTISEM